MSAEKENEPTEKLADLESGMRTVRFGGFSSESEEDSHKKAFLTVIRSRADLGVHRFVEERILLGRAPECNFPVHDYGVSWQHATITPHGNDEYVLTDLQSTNGTHVNGALLDGPH